MRSNTIHLSVSQETEGSDSDLQHMLGRGNENSSSPGPEEMAHADLHGLSSVVSMTIDLDDLEGEQNSTPEQSWIEHDNNGHRTATDAQRIATKQEPALGVELQRATSTVQLRSDQVTGDGDNLTFIPMKNGNENRPFSLQRLNTAVGHQVS